MANFICEFKGVRGRILKLYDTKCVIITKVSLGSVVTGNATDGMKTLFYSDITGIQFKRSGLAIGYLQLETPAMQMNNISSNFFSENTFTFEEGKYGLTNSLMETVYDYIADRMEEVKYGVKVIDSIPDFDLMKISYNENFAESEDEFENEVSPEEMLIPEYNRRKNRFSCPKCGSDLEKNQKRCLCSSVFDWSRF